MLASRGLTEFYNSRWAETNMVSSLACAEDWLKLEPCIVSYSDIFYGSYAVKSLMKSGAPLALTYDPNWLQLWKRRFGSITDAETFRLTSEGTLADIGNKPNSVGEVQGNIWGCFALLREDGRSCSNPFHIVGSRMRPDSHDRHASDAYQIKTISQCMQFLIKENGAKLIQIPIYQYTQMTDSSDYVSQICTLSESQILSFGWSYILDEYSLERHKVALNVHPALLPKFVGPTTGAYAVLEDERATGLTVRLVNSELDGGAILALQSKTLPDFPPAQTPESSKIDPPKPVKEPYD